MHVTRHYFISDDLDDLEVVEEQLEEGGISTPQIHVLSLDDTGVENHHHLHDVTSFMKKDVIRSGELGLLVGLIGSAAVLGLAWLLGWTESPAGWIPFVFLAIIVVGFCTWEGGFIGIQTTNKHFKRFEKELEEGKHVFFIDLEPGQEEVLERVTKAHKQLKPAGTEKGTPHWVMEGQKRIPRLLTETLP